MSPPDAASEILDSEDDEDGAFNYDEPSSLELSVAPQQQQQPVGCGGGSDIHLQLQTVDHHQHGVESSHVPTSGELRQKAINAAVNVLVAPSSVSSPQKNGEQQLARGSHLTTDISPPAIPEKVPTGGGDVYDFTIVDDDDDDDINVTAPTTTTKSAAKKKRKRAKTAIGILPDYSGGSDYEETTITTRPTTKRKNTKQPKQQQRSKTMPFTAVGVESDDVFVPDSKAQPAARNNGRKSTRSNTSDKDLLPLLPKPRRKKDLTKELADFLSAPALDEVKIDAENGEGGGAAEVSNQAQAPGDSPRRPFMIDMTHDDLTLPIEKKDEYQPIDRYTIDSTIGTPVLDSTIPDPPELYELAADGPAQLTPEHPPPESMTSPTPPPQLASKRRRAKTDMYVGVGSGLDSDGGIRIASEWRAAKGKGRQNLSDKQQPVNQPDDELAMHSDGGPQTTNTKKKQPRKTKQKESAKKKKGKGTNDKQIAPVPAHEVGDTIAVATGGTDDLADAMTAEEQGGASKSTSNTADVNNTSHSVLDIYRTDVGSTGGTISVAPVPGSPLPKKYLRTKTRLPPDSDDEMGNFDAARAKRSEPELVKPMEETPRPAKAKTSRKRTRSKVKPMSADEDEEDAEFTEEKVSPVITKRKRTKSCTKVAEEDAPPLKKATATKRGRTRSKIEKVQPDNELKITTTPDKAQDKSITVCGEPMTEDPKSEPPKTPPKPISLEKKLQGEKSRGSHSPIRGGKIPHRVGLSKRARIEPLLSIRKK